MVGAGLLSAPLAPVCQDWPGLKGAPDLRAACRPCRALHDGQASLRWPKKARSAHSFAPPIEVWSPGRPFAESAGNSRRPAYCETSHPVRIAPPALIRPAPLARWWLRVKSSADWRSSVKADPACCAAAQGPAPRRLLVIERLRAPLIARCLRVARPLAPSGHGGPTPHRSPVKVHEFTTCYLA